MKEEFINRALDEINDARLLEAALYAPAVKKARVPKRAVKVLLIAALLTSLFSVTAFAVWQSAFRTRSPEPGEKVTFHIWNADQSEYLPREANVAMLITVEGAETGRWVLLRDHWLPEPTASSDRLKRTSFYEVMSFYSDHTLYVGWRQRPLEELLAEAGLSAEEAEIWYSRIYCERPSPEPLLNIEVFNATMLYDRPLIFGNVEGATAQIIREGTLGPYELLELQVDMSAFYREKLGVEPKADLQLQNHVLLYEPTEKYLIHIGGSDCAYDFETLEKIGENLEVLVTDFETQRPEMASDYLYSDLGRG